MLAADARAAMRQERQAQANIAAQGAVVTKNSVLNDQGKHGLVLPVVVHGERGNGGRVGARVFGVSACVCVRAHVRDRKGESQACRVHVACMSHAFRMHVACMSDRMSRARLVEE